ncbi:hypothetical protein J6590_095075 [Homalodisca vitripennis]|nr:hypothetical protein J6590_095075 [Homalodisca vitripennis]
MRANDLPHTAHNVQFNDSKILNTQKTTNNQHGRREIRESEVSDTARTWARTQSVIESERLVIDKGVSQRACSTGDNIRILRNREKHGVLCRSLGKEGAQVFPNCIPSYGTGDEDRSNVRQLFHGGQHKNSKEPSFRTASLATALVTRTGRMCDSCSTGDNIRILRNREKHGVLCRSLGKEGAQVFPNCIPSYGTGDEDRSNVRQLFHGGQHKNSKEPRVPRSSRTASLATALVTRTGRVCDSCSTGDNIRILRNREKHGVLCRSLGKEGVQSFRTASLATALTDAMLSICRSAGFLPAKVRCALINATTTASQISRTPTERARKTAYQNFS